LSKRKERSPSRVEAPNMHRQFYDSEEESEPRVTPKPVTKFDVIYLSNIILYLCKYLSLHYALYSD